MMLIGAGDHTDGLYYFRGQPGVKGHKVAGVGSLDLWHARLGHPSHKVTKLVTAVDTRKGSYFLNKHCDIYH